MLDVPHVLVCMPAPGSRLFGEIGLRQNWVGDDLGVYVKNIQKVDFWKILGMAWPIVENVPTPRGSIYCVSRGFQLPYMKKNVFVCIFVLIELPIYRHGGLTLLVSSLPKSLSPGNLKPFVDDCRGCLEPILPKHQIVYPKKSPQWDPRSPKELPNGIQSGPNGFSKEVSETIFLNKMCQR